MKYTDTDGRKWHIVSTRWITLNCNADNVITSIDTCAVISPEGFDEATKELVITEQVEPAQAAQIEAALAFQPKLAVDKLTRKELVTPKPAKPIKDIKK